MDEYKTVKDAIVAAVVENLPGTEPEIEKTAVQIADTVMEVITENYRSLTQVQSIVDAVRAGHRVQIAYYNPDEDELDGMVVRACW